MGRDIAVDKSARSYQHVITNGNLSDHRSIHTDTDAIADRGRPQAWSPALHSNCNAFMQMAIVTQGGIPIDCDVVGMSKIEPLSNPSTTRNLNSVLSRMNSEKPLEQKAAQRILARMGLSIKIMPDSQIGSHLIPIPFQITAIKSLECSAIHVHLLFSMSAESILYVGILPKLLLALRVLFNKPCKELGKIDLF